MRYEIISDDLKDIAEQMSSNSLNINNLAHKYGLPSEILKKVQESD